MEKQIESSTDWLKLSSELEELVSSLKSDNYELRSELKFLKGKLSELEKKNSEKDLALSSLKSALYDKTAETEKIWAGFEKARSEADALVLKNEAAESRLRELMKETENYRMEALKLEASLERVGTGFENKIALLKKELSGKEKEIQSLKNAIDALSLENKKAGAEIEDKTAALRNSKKEFMEKEALFRKIKLENEDLRTELEALSARDYGEREKILIGGLKEKKAALDEAERKISALEKAKKGLAEDIEILKDRAERSAGEASAEAEKVRGLQKRIGEIQILEKEMLEKKERISFLESRLKELEFNKHNMPEGSSDEKILEELSEYVTALNAYRDLFENSGGPAPDALAAFKRILAAVNEKLNARFNKKTRRGSK